MNIDPDLDTMASNLSSNVKREVAKYIDVYNKKNVDILNQFPLVKSLRCQIAKYENDYVAGLKTLQEKFEMLEKKQKSQAHLCKSRAIRSSRDGSPQCWASYAEAKNFASQIDIEEKKIWLQWSKMNPLPQNIPSHPQKFYRGNGWTSWYDFLGLEENRVSLTVTEIDNKTSSVKDIKTVTIASEKKAIPYGAESEMQQNDIIKTNNSINLNTIRINKYILRYICYIVFIS